MDNIYSALHYAAKAEKSATSAAASAKSAADTANKLNSLLPSQADNAGKYLTTDGVNPKWDTVVSTTITYWE